MAYEATVPVHRRLLWSAVIDPERLLSAMPNLVVEAAGAGHGVAGRLRMRVGERSITFRGSARLVECSPEQLRAVLEIEAVHGRSDGALEGHLEIRLLPSGDGTRVVLRPDLNLSGREPGIPAEQLAEAARRLVPRWFDQLAGSSPEPSPAEPGPLTVVPDAGPEDAGTPEAAGPEDAALGTANGALPGGFAADEPRTPASPAARPPAGPPPAAPAPHGPTLKLISGTGEAQQPGAAPGQAGKAPLRLVSAADQDPQSEPADEPDLWSRHTGRFVPPMWFVGAALLATAGGGAILVRWLLKRDRTAGRVVR